jgi:multidrug efflux pump subunit AcrB
MRASKIGPDRRSVITTIAMAATTRWKATLAALAVVVAVGVTAFGVGLDREGFPPVNTPISVVAGTWFVDDAAAVDAELVRPLVEAFTGVDGVVSTESQARPSSFVVVVEFESDIDSDAGTAALIALGLELPDGADVEYNAVNAARFVGQYDVLVSVVGAPDAPFDALDAQADVLAGYLEADPAIERADVRRAITDSIDPATGQAQQRQTRFTRVALSSDGYRDAVAIGIVRSDTTDLDVLAFSDRLEGLLADAAVLDPGFDSFVTADFATGVRSQLSSLTTNLLTGLVAVSLISLILIGWRVAVLTAGFMSLVMIGALAGLWGVGYSLNTITLFGLILTLGLIVDDAIVISESIDANSDTDAAPLGVIRSAIDRVGSPSFAGTITTVVVFSPMLFVGGILGEFIRPIPTTVIITLLLSFAFSIVFIPTIARWFLVGRRPSRNPVASAERRLAHGAGRLAAYPSGNGPKGWAVGGALAAFAVVVVFSAGSIAGGLGFSIFPAGKDAVALQITAEFPPGTTIDDAQAVADEIDAVVVEVLDDDLVRSQYLRGNERVAETFIDLTPIGDRPTAPQFVERIEAGLADVSGVRVTVGQVENGPPSLDFPFAAQISVDSEAEVAAAQELAAEMRDDLAGRELSAAGGTITVLDAIISTEGEIARADGRRYVEVRAKFDNDQVTSNLNAARSHVEQRFAPAELEARGLTPDALGFDFGFESDNQEDFAALGVAGLVALALMLLVITVQFRSLAQSLLIFLAIPFSFFGVFSLLSITDNPLSFLVLVGFIALIGVAVNNTILLVDAANRARRDGATAAEAIQEAVTRRFRPLVATTLTTVVGLLPLSLSDPFWESLGFTLIGGLVSSTTLVLLAFPAFYLGLEAVRTPVRNAVRRRTGRPEVR